MTKEGRTPGAFGVIAPHPPIMVPEVGGRDAPVTAASAQAMRTASELLDHFAPETLVVMSPHAPAAADAFVIDDAAHFAGSLAEFGAPDMRIEAAGDPELARAIADGARAGGLAVVLRTEAVPHLSGHLGHGELVPLFFLDRDGRYPLVVLSLSWVSYGDHRAFGAIVRSAAAGIGRRVAFIASGDCSHRLKPGAPAGFSLRGAEFDSRLVELVHAGDLERLGHMDESLVESAGECGLRSFVTLGGFAPDASTRVLSYEGPWGVGYMTAVVASPDIMQLIEADSGMRATAYDIPPDTASNGSKGGAAGRDESPHVQLARATLEAYLRDHRVIDDFVAYAELLGQRAGAFVSLHRADQLRGCIGTIAPTQQTLAAEIVHNAIQAATCDPRFPRMTVDELPDLEISVDVLHEAELVASVDDLDPKRYGVIVSTDRSRGLLLPDLEGVETGGQQIAIAMRKAGIAPGTPITLERFRVDRYR